MSGIPGFRKRTGSGLAAWLTRVIVASQCMDLLKVESIMVLGGWPCMKGSIGGRGVDDMRLKRAGSRSRTAAQVAPLVWAPKLHARERKRPLPRCCGHRELPCCGGVRQWAAGIVVPVGDGLNRNT